MKGAVRRKDPKQKVCSADLTEQIRTRAYYLAEKRNFAPGRELDDWLQAEREILKKKTI